MQVEPLSSDRVFKRIAELLRVKVDTTETIVPETEILKDLGLWGDDAGDFFDAYVEEFNLDMAKLKFTDYFPRDGDEIWLFIKCLVTGRKKHEFYRPIKISDLVEFAITKIWKIRS